MVSLKKIRIIGLMFFSYFRMMFWPRIANKISIGHISSLPIQKSNINTSFVIMGEVEVMSPDPSPTLLKADATSNITCGTFW